MGNVVYNEVDGSKLAEMPSQNDLKLSAWLHGLTILEHQQVLAAIHEVSPGMDYAKSLVKIVNEWHASRRQRPIQSEVVRPIVLDTELRDWIASQIADVNQEIDCIFYTNETLCEIPSMQSQNETLKLQSERILDAQSKLAEIVENIDNRLNPTG